MLGSQLVFLHGCWRRSPFVSANAYRNKVGRQASVIRGDGIRALYEREDYPLSRAMRTPEGEPES